MNQKTTLRGGFLICVCYSFEMQNITKNIAVWTLIAAAFVPTVVFQNLAVPEIDGKLIIYRLIAFVAVATVFIDVLFCKEGKNRMVKMLSILRKDRLFLVLSIHTLILGVGSIFAFEQKLSFFGGPDRGEGFLTMFVFWILYALMRTLFERRDWMRLFVTWSLVTFVLFVIQCLQAAHGIPRPASTIGNPIFLGALYLFSLFTALELISYGKKAKRGSAVWLGAVSGVCAIIGIFLTNSRGILVGLFAALLAVGIHDMRLRARAGTMSARVKKVAIVTVIVALLAFGGFMATRGFAFWQKIPGLSRLAKTSVSGGTAASRLYYSRIGITGFVEDATPVRFLVGWGMENYVYVWGKQYDPRVYQYDRNLPDHSHNKVVDELVMGGVLGLLSYLAVWYLFFRNALRSTRTDVWVAAAFIGWGVAYFVQNLFAFDTLVTYWSVYVLWAFSAHLGISHD